MRQPHCTKKACLFALLLVCSSSLFAQPATVADSMKYYNKLGQYTKALPFAQQQYALTAGLAENDTVRIAAVYDLGFDYYFMAKYDSAAVYFARTCDAYKTVYGEVSFQYTGSLSNLASAYKNLSKYDLAEALYAETLTLKKAFNGEDSGYAISLNQLGLLYFTTGKYDKAEQLFLKACSIFKKTGEKTAAYALAAGNLALVYSRVGNYARAEKLQQQALTARKEILGEHHPMYALALTNLGTLYGNMGNYAKADSFHTLALQIFKASLKEEHPQYLRGLHKLGVGSTKLKKYTAAESYFTQAIEGWQSAYGEDDVDYLFMFDALSNLYAKMGKNELAEPRFLQSLAHYDKLQMQQHPFRLDLLYNIIDLYLAARSPARAEKYLLEAMQVEDRALLDKLDFLSETEILFYQQKRTQALALAEPYLFLQQQKSAAILKAAYNSRLLFTGISLQNMKQLRGQMMAAADSTVTGIWNKYQNNKSLLNKLLSLPAAKRTASADSVNELAYQQEKQLLRLSASYRTMKEKLQLGWQDVRNALQPGEAAIEFVRFDYYVSQRTDSVFYAAMLLRPQDTVPRFVQLFEEKQLLAALKGFAYKAAVNTGSNTWAPTATNKGRPVALYQLVWQPLEPFLAKTKTVYFSPDGLLYQLAFAAIPAGNGQLLCDKYQLVQLSSTREIAAAQNKPAPAKNIALFGGINYNTQSSDSSQLPAADLYAYAYQQNRGTGTDSFRYLPNTMKEVTIIEKEMLPRGKTIFLFTGANATEQAFRQLGGNKSPDIIHFATHGFTLPGAAAGEAQANSFQVSDNPLLRCGLVMAGGNKGWKGLTAAEEDDGILTGLEISLVPLPNTALVVLSACETGLGQLQGTEGVFGLQRAFKMAGAAYVMASLWQVPDKETAAFMEHFYKDWLSSNNIRQAFLSTQQFFRKKYPPYYWAAFTLVQ